jgi:hypothetical protein
LAVALALVAGAVAAPAEPASAQLPLTTLLVKGNGEVPSLLKQVIVVNQPSQVKLTWGFCNAQSCGTSQNIECVGNKYMPGYGVLEKLKVGAPTGFKLKGLFTLFGPLTNVLNQGLSQIAESMKALDQAALESVATPSGVGTDPDGGVNIKLDTGGIGDTLKFDKDFNMVCGHPEEEKQAIVADLGPEPTNPTAKGVIGILWEKSRNTSGPITQQISTNNDAPVSIPPIDLSGVADALKGIAGILQPVIEQVTKSLAAPTFQNLRVPAPPDAKGAQTGTGTPDQFVGGSPAPKWFPMSSNVAAVPVAVTTALAYAGVSVPPADAAKSLLQSGAWKPGTGTDFNAMVGATKGIVNQAKSAMPPAQAKLFEGVTVGPATITDVIASFESETAGPSAFVADFELEKGGSAVATITGYDAAKDRLTVVPQGGKPHTLSLEAAAPSLRNIMGVRHHLAPVLVTNI